MWETRRLVLPHTAAPQDPARGSKLSTTWFSIPPPPLSPWPSLSPVLLRGSRCPSQQFSLLTARSRVTSRARFPDRLRLRLSLHKSLSKTSPERRADTRSSNSPPSSSALPAAWTFRCRCHRSRSRCSFSCRARGERLRLEQPALTYKPCLLAGAPPSCALDASVYQLAPHPQDALCPLRLKAFSPLGVLVTSAPTVFLSPCPPHTYPNHCLLGALHSDLPLPLQTLPPTHHGFHACPPFLLLLPPPHGLQVLPGL